MVSRRPPGVHRPRLPHRYKSPARTSRRQIWFDGSVKVRLVGYKHETVVAFVEIIGPDGERPDATLRANADNLDLATAEANDQSLLLYGEFGFKARPGQIYRVATSLARNLGPGSPNLDELTLAVPIDGHGKSRLRYGCVEGSRQTPSRQGGGP